MNLVDKYMSLHSNNKDKKAHKPTDLLYLLLGMEKQDFLNNEMTRVRHELKKTLNTLFNNKTF